MKTNFDFISAALTFFFFAIDAYPQIDYHPDIQTQFEYYAVEFDSISADSTASNLFKRALDSFIPSLQQTSSLATGHSTARQVLEWDLGFEVIGQIGSLDGHYLIRKRSHNPINDYQLDEENKGQHLFQLNQHSQVKWALRQLPRKLHKRSLPLDTIRNITRDKLGIKDPEFDKQWHLVNPDNRDADINVTGVWDMGITGRGVVVAAIDDGIDYRHADLADNFNLASSYDFNLRKKEPLPMLEDDVHGTRCAGEIVAAAHNAVCGVGVAFDAKVAGIRLLSGRITTTDEALAINYGMQENQIYSCSWGPKDDGAHVEGPNQLVLNAIINGISNGRGGLGNVFVFATGNGGALSDNCNYDGYTNSIFGISIGAIDNQNQHPTYSEECSAHLAVTYSSNSLHQHAINTCDVTVESNGNRSSVCTDSHGGTSAAAPVAVGILALVLSVRPDLSYRDMQHITLRGSVPINLEVEGEWEPTHYGRKYSYKYGYGKLDAYQAIMVAKNWTNVRKQTRIESPIQTPQDSEISHGPQGVNFSFEITKSMVAMACLDRVEHVTVTVNVRHDRRGDLDFYLISPNNVVSYIGPHRVFDRSTKGFTNWTFSSVKHWEEDPVGIWKLKIVDMFNPSQTGFLDSWKLIVWGEETVDAKYFTPVYIGSQSSLGVAVLLIVLFGLCGVGVYFGVQKYRNRKLFHLDEYDEIMELTPTTTGGSAVSKRLSDVYVENPSLKPLKAGSNHNLTAIYQLAGDDDNNEDDSDYDDGFQNATLRA